jgi:hypothetical protein
MPDHAGDRGAVRLDPGASRSPAYQPECVSAALPAEVSARQSPGLHEPGRPDRKGHGPRWTVLSAAGSAPAGSANGLAGSVSGTGKTARRCGPSWPPRSPPGLLARPPGIRVMVTSAWLYAFAGTGPATPPMSAASCNTGRMPGLPEPGIPRVRC